MLCLNCYTSQRLLTSKWNIRILESKVVQWEVLLSTCNKSKWELSSSCPAMPLALPSIKECKLLAQIPIEMLTPLLTHLWCHSKDRNRVSPLGQETSTVTSCQRLLVEKSKYKPMPLSAQVSNIQKANGSKLWNLISFLWLKTLTKIRVTLYFMMRTKHRRTIFSKVTDCEFRSQYVSDVRYDVNFALPKG